MSARVWLPVSLCALGVVGASACFNLDSFVWNPKHCSTVDVDDPNCTDKEMCTACGGALPFQKWGIAPARVTQHPIELADGETNDSWFIASEGGDLDDVTIIFSHGNFGGIEHYLNRVAVLADTGANIYAVDYRGMGQSSTAAEPTEAQFLDDTQRARAFARDVIASHGKDPERVVLMGYSAGALSAVAMADDDSSCGMVLEAPWPSVHAFAGDSTFIGVPGSFVTQGQWNNIDPMRRYAEPVLVFHGEEDTTVRIELGRELFDAIAHDDKAFIAVAGAAHGNDLGKGDVDADVVTVLGRGEYVAEITNFIAGLSCP
jgi:pimeloyl-ACP methyl ester carboxylesterase